MIINYLIKLFFLCLPFVFSNYQLIGNIESYECFFCIELKKGYLLGLPASHSPCLHGGQPIFKWPNSSFSACKAPEKIYSKDFDYDTYSGLVFAKYPICFYDKDWKINYKFKCNLKWKNNYIRVFHEVRNLII